MKKILFLLLIFTYVALPQAGKSVLTSKQRDSIRTMIGYINVKDYYAAGDSVTDDTDAFQSAINAGDKIFVPEGVYTVDSLVLKSNTQLIGIGTGSKLCLKAGGTVLMNVRGAEGGGAYTWLPSLSGIKINNLWLSGLDATETAGGVPTLGNRTGIHIDNAADIYVDNVKITGFDNAGIISECTDTAVTYTFNVNVSNCRIESNYYGIWVKELSEYGFYSNNLIQGYNIGVRLIGGNNTFSNNQILNGTTGLYLESGENDSHGSFTGGSINHNVFAIYADSVRTSENITGINLWYGKIYFNFSRGIKIMNSTIMTDTIIFTGGDCANTGFTGCTFRDDNVYISRDKGVDQSIMKNNNFFGTLLGIDDILINDINIEPYEPNISGLPSMVFNKVDSSYITIADDNDLNFGTKDFTIEWFGYLKPDGTYQYLIDKSSILYPGFWLTLSSVNTIQFTIYGIDNNLTVGDSPTITEGYYHIVATRQDTNLAFYINGDSLDEYARPLLTENAIYNYYSGASISNTDDLILGRYKYPVLTPSGYYDGEVNLVRLYNFAVSGTQAVDMFTTGLPNLSEVPYRYKWGSQDSLTSGTLELGKTYIIDNWITGDDFTNVGGTNEDSSIFIATGTTPTTWSNSSILRKLGCVAEYRAENSAITTWEDNSDNSLDGTNTNVTPNYSTYIIALPETLGVTAGYVPKKQSDGTVLWQPDISTSGTGLFNQDGVWIDTTAAGLATVTQAVKDTIALVKTKQDKDTDLDNPDLPLSVIQDSLTAKANTAWFAIAPHLLDDSLTTKMNRAEMSGYATASHTHSEFADTVRVAGWSMGMGNSDLDTLTAGSFGGIKIENNYTITEVSAYTNSGTVTFNIEERVETTPNTAGVDVMTSDLVADTDQQETGTFSNATIDRDDWLILTIVSITGDPTIFSVTVRGVKTN